MDEKTRNGGGGRGDFKVFSDDGKFVFTLPNKQQQQQPTNSDSRNTGDPRMDPQERSTRDPRMDPQERSTRDPRMVPQERSTRDPRMVPQQSFPTMGKLQRTPKIQTMGSESFQFQKHRNNTETSTRNAGGASNILRYDARVPTAAEEAGGPISRAARNGSLRCISGGVVAEILGSFNSIQLLDFADVCSESERCGSYLSRCEGDEVASAPVQQLHSAGDTSDEGNSCVANLEREDEHELHCSSSNCNIFSPGSTAVGCCATACTRHNKNSNGCDLHNVEEGKLCQ